MEQLYTSGLNLQPHCGPHLELLLLQFLNQLRTQHNSTENHTLEIVQHCVQNLNQEEKHRQELISQCEKRNSMLTLENWFLETKHISNGIIIESLNISLTESSQRYEEKISTLEREIHKERSARILCEREAKLQKDYSYLEQVCRELYQMKNGSHKDDGKINSIIRILQQIYKNYDLRKQMLILENQLNLAKESLQKSTEMCLRQSRELEDERRTTQYLEAQNAQLKTTLRDLQKQQQEQKENFEAKIKNLKRRKSEALAKKYDELTTERKKNLELQRKIYETQKSQRDSEKQNAQLLEAERRKCSMQLQEKKPALESAFERVKRKTHEAQKQLKN